MRKNNKKTIKNEKKLDFFNKKIYNIMGEYYYRGLRPG
jgi:hypothetical protein